MAGNASALKARRFDRNARGTSEPTLVKVGLTSVTLLFLVVFLILPLVAVFYQAFQGGKEVYLAALKDPDTIASIKLTLLTALISVPLNVLFGICAAWVITKYQFRAKNLLLTLIDLPFAVSPVIAGLIFVLLFGRDGVLGPWLSDHNIKIIFAVPGIVLATLFVTFPFVARELIPIMEAQGVEEEQAAMVLGAKGWQTFWKVTLPNVKWGLLYGIILCNARAVGEFGAVSVVSGHIAGLTNTMPLQVELLFNDYNLTGSFAVASLLSVIALVTLIVKGIVEWNVSRSAKADESENPLGLEAEKGPAALSL